MKTPFVLITLFCSCVYLVGCGDENLPPMDDILKLTLKDTANMMANGKYKFTVMAKIPHNAKDNYRTVSFTTSSGKFESSEKGAVEVQIDSEGKAEVSVVVGDTPGNFFITAAIGQNEPKFSVSERFRLLPILTSDIIVVDLIGTSDVIADGESVITINATIKNTPLDNITVSTTDGTFVESGKDTDNSKVDQSGKASFRLRVGSEPGSYFITSSISEDIKVVSEVIVARAYADSILSEPNALIVGPKTAVDITVFLKRKTGKVSVNTPISCRAYQLSEETKVFVGRFTGISEGSDSSGKITIHFYADSKNIDSIKPIILEISTPQEDFDPTPYTQQITLKYEEPDES